MDKEVQTMGRRKRVSRRASRRLFRRTSGTHKRNIRRPILRGGTRL